MGSVGMSPENVPDANRYAAGGGTGPACACVARWAAARRRPGELNNPNFRCRAARHREANARGVQLARLRAPAPGSSTCCGPSQRQSEGFDTNVSSLTFGFPPVSGAQ